MLRDTLASEEYFTSLIQKADERVVRLRSEIVDEIAERGLDASSTAKLLVAEQLRCATMAYSRGDALDEIASRIEQGLLDGRFLHQILKDDSNAIKSRGLSYLLVFLRLSLAVLFCPATPAGRQAAKDIQLLTDRDAILTSFATVASGQDVASETLSDQLLYPKEFDEINQAIRLESDGSSPLKRYLYDWYQTYDNRDGAGVFGIGSHKKMVRYAGYWCWAAAAVSVMMDIDDSSFRDHQHYPKDLADWARRRHQ